MNNFVSELFGDRDSVVDRNSAVNRHSVVNRDSVVDRNSVVNRESVVSRRSAVRKSYRNSCRRSEISTATIKRKEDMMKDMNTMLTVHQNYQCDEC